MIERPPEIAGMFDRVGDTYEARPGYPDEVFRVLVERCGLGAGTRVLEIGPGPGQATLPVLDLGATVTAIEPGAALARRLRERTRGRPVEVVVSRFEDAELPEAGFDLAISATAFHWVDPIIGIRQCARFVRPGGWLALWWTFWGDPDRPDPFHGALVPVLEANAPHMLSDDEGARAFERDAAARAAEAATSGAFDTPTAHTILWEGTHDPAELRAIFATFGQWIAQPEPLRTDLLDSVAGIVRDTFGGHVTRPYKTVLYTAQRQHGAGSAP
jgi:SAM-dependent methyltransferase